MTTTGAALRLISSMATKALAAELVAQFAGSSPGPVQVESVGGVDAARRVSAGEAFDGVVLAAGAIDTLMAAGHVLPGSRVDLVTSAVAAAVRAGAPQPPIDSVAAMRQAVLAATSVGYSTGPSGVQLMELFERWGIRALLGDRLVQAPPGVPVASLVARGEVELGFQQLSELMGVPGITLLPPLPKSVQIVTTFSAAIARTSVQPDEVRSLLTLWASPAAAATKRRCGMEPA
ncbi:MAG TPA: substrate-binding domain-containing protein [Rubrivivax sp.]|nr:substrate-binding domain-containing protein [Rubrivivax sp.]